MPSRYALPFWTTCLNRWRMFSGDSKSYRRAVILDINAKLLQAKDAEEQFLYVRRQVIEGIRKLRGARCITIAKAEIVGRNHMPVIC